MTFQISPTTRVRPSPFYEATVADGVQSFTVYNHMLMPTGYGDPEAEYWRLINGVAMWDVAVERQVELAGPDAFKLAQLLCPRKLDSMPDGVGWYVPLCDHKGVILNDPVLLRHSKDRFWLSIADSDVLWWVRAIASERSLDVDVFEPDVSPLAVQGPRAEDTVANLLGEEIRTIRHFRFRAIDLDGIPLVVARSGYSKQGGFELYLCDGSKGTELWERVKQAGEPYGIGPGTPNPVERVESGLLSWGSDTDHRTNPFEVRLGRYIDLDAPDDVVSIKALRDIHAEGVHRHQVGFYLDTPEALGPMHHRLAVHQDGRTVGELTAIAWSPRLERNIGLGLVERSAEPGSTVSVSLPKCGQVQAKVAELPFL